MNTMRPHVPDGTAARLAIIGLMLAMPAVYFVTANVLKYEFNLLPGLSVYPFSPLILLGGLGLALALNLYPVFRMEVQRQAGELHVKMVFRSSAWNLAILLVAGLLLAALLLYAIVENLGTP